MQNRITIDDWDTIQPTKFEYNFQTTSTQSSGRSMSGKATITPLFTVEAFNVEYKNLTAGHTSQLLRRIVQRPKKPYFTLHYYSPYFGEWKTGQFYVGEGSLNIDTLEENGEFISNISCSFVGRNKLC